MTHNEWMEIAIWLFWGGLALVGTLSLLLMIYFDRKDSENDKRDG